MLGMASGSTRPWVETPAPAPVGMPIPVPGRLPAPGVNAGPPGAGNWFMPGVMACPAYGWPGVVCCECSRFRNCAGFTLPCGIPLKA